RGRLIEDKYLRHDYECAGNLDPLLRLDRQIANAVMRADADTEVGKMLDPACVQLSPSVDPLGAGGAELHRLGTGKGRWQGKILVEEPDAGISSQADVARRDFVSADQKPSALWHDHSGGNAGEGRFAGAVRADHRVDHIRRKSS